MTDPVVAQAPVDVEDRFRLLVSAVSDYAIYMLSPEGIVSSWNTGAQRFKGYTGVEIIGQHFSRFYTPEDQRAGMPARALRRALEEGKFEDEGWRVRKDGSHFWASIVVDPVRDAAGRLVGFAKITRDITERKRAAEALHTSEERFRLLVQGVTDYAIYMLSPEGLITNWNVGAERIKGYSESEVINTHFSRFYTPDDAAAGVPQRALATAAAEGRFEAEGWRMRKDGSRFWAHVVIDSIRNSLGELIGFAKVTRDITERQRAQLALEKAKEALFQSQKVEAIGKLTGGVAHDFNNLLSVMLNGVELLKKRLRDPDDLRTLDAMERAGKRGATLTRQLLTFARQQPLDPKRHSVNEVLLSFEAVLRRANRADVGFELQLASNLPLVLVDAPQVEAAVLNLIVNARDATPDGGAITLRTDEVQLDDGMVGALKAGRYVTISVSDTGAGMAPDVLKRAVEPFFTTKPIGAGTGLGLSQTFGLMQQSGGDLAIASTPGRGTCVTMYFPALPDQQASAVAVSTRSETALVVDDQEDVLAMAAELFRSMGYDVLLANNGVEALQILKRTPEVDVLFTDVMMPQMTGVELAREARALRPGVKIILASGYSAPAAGVASLDDDSVQFVSKPYSLSQIMRQLRSPNRH